MASSTASEGRGWDTVGEIVDFQNTFLLCYVVWPTMLAVPFWIAGLGIALFRMESAPVAAPTAAVPPPLPQ